MESERPYFTCFGCNDRFVGCHSKCEKYQAEKAEWQKMMNAKAEEDKRIFNVQRHKKRMREKS